MPPYFCGAIATVVFSYLADKKRIRWPFIVIPYSIALIGFIGLISIPHPRYPGLTYGLLFLIPIGVYPPIVALISWVGNNLSPTWKRATGMALLITLGNYGGKSRWITSLFQQTLTIRRCHWQQHLPSKAETSLLAGLRVQHWHSGCRYRQHFHYKMDISPNQQVERCHGS